MSRGEAKQLELIGMTSVAEIPFDSMIDSSASYALAVSAKSAAVEASGAASFETEE